MPLLSPVFRRSHFRHQVPPRPPRRERSQRRKWELWARMLSGNDDFHAIWGSFTCRKSTTWDRRLYFPSEGRRAEDFSPLKIRRLRPGLNPRTWVLKASTLPLDHRSRCISYNSLQLFMLKRFHCSCREVCGLAIASPHTSLHWKQRTHKYMICCHITHNNGRLIVLIRDFS